ncbi:MAG: hypothetical protein GXP49_14555 [Deltaproteobacteria bacterium]|nr:hypothetical protein [Deltaproteobacteria bacterium]
MNCNGSKKLCDRTFDKVCLATTHNAMSSTQDGFVPPNQHYALPRQLADGIRGLMLDIHYWKGDVYLCHGACEFGKKPLVEGLSQILDFLEQEPNEVVAIVFESYVEAKDVEAAFVDSKLVDLVYTPSNGQKWPTLSEMIAANQRVVVLTDRDGGNPEWYLPVWDYAFETHFSAKTREDLTCDPNRGSTDNSLFILNHFLTKPFADPDLAEQVNHNPFFIDRAEECAKRFRRRPSMVAVDFYDIGDLLDVVDELNKIEFNKN